MSEERPAVVGLAAKGEILKNVRAANVLDTGILYCIENALAVMMKPWTDDEKLSGDSGIPATMQAMIGKASSKDLTAVKF